MRRWKRRDKDHWEYTEVVEGQLNVLATVEADRPNSGHFAIWTWKEKRYNYPTLSGAKDQVARWWEGRR